MRVLGQGEGSRVGTVVEVANVLDCECVSLLYSISVLLLPLETLEILTFAGPFGHSKLPLVVVTLNSTAEATERRVVRMEKRESFMIVN